jgi:integrase
MALSRQLIDLAYVYISLTLTIAPAALALNTRRRRHDAKRSWALKGSSVLTTLRREQLTRYGRNLSSESFRNWFREACKAASVSGSAHGLRKAGAARAANNGATGKQLEAIYGWTGGKMGALHTQQADRVRLA